MKYLLILLISFAALSCGVTRMEEISQPMVYGNIITHYNDSSGVLKRRFVFTGESCDKRVVQDQYGKKLKRIDGLKEGDSFACYTCFDIDNPKTSMIHTIDYKFGFSYEIDFSKCGFRMFGSYCSKAEIILRQRFADSIPLVFWNKLDKDKGKLIFYMAEDNAAYPYHVSSTLDSIVYDLNSFCSMSEIMEEKDNWRSLLDRYVKVNISPNPFIESFEMSLSADNIEIFVAPIGKTLSFYDEMGNLLKSQQIVLDQVYTFSFPEVKSGKTIYYKITWPDYELSGQIRKQ